FEQHLGETEDRLRRLENVFQILGVTPKGVKCPAIDGILEEADDVSGETADEAVLDAALIASAQAVAHYAIARYGALFAWAKALGREECAQLLSETLAEEKNADRNLSSLAEGRINRKAA
ncbi:MAG: ferritin-like domain-containing protein, partial [Methylocystis sp.]